MEKIIMECRASSLPASEYIRRNNISEGKYYYWVRLIREELVNQMGSVMPAPTESAPDEKTIFAPVQLQEIHPSVKDKKSLLLYYDRFQIEVTENTSSKLLEMSIAGGEQMNLDLSSINQIYIACGHTDMRMSIDGLATIVQQQFKMNPFERNLFLFCGRRRNRLKALLWDDNGFLIVYKRLEGGRFIWPNSPDEVRALSRQQFRWLLEGLNIDQKRTLKSVHSSTCL